MSLGEAETTAPEMLAEAAFREAEAFADLARRRLRREAPSRVDPIANPEGDHRLNGLLSPATNGPRAAAVLVPIVARRAGLSVLLTERATGLRNHSGQIAFPGGKIDPEDPSALDAALREADEEIGLSRRHVTPLGYLDPYWSGTGFLIIPVVALVAAEADIAPNPAEVAGTFEVPLAFLMDEANHELHARAWKGLVRQYYAMPFEDHYIWGVTAGIIRNLYVNLHDVADLPPD